MIYYWSAGGGRLLPLPHEHARQSAGCCALLLLYCLFTAALLPIYCCFTDVLLILYKAQDNYVHDSKGIQQKVFRLKRIIGRLAPLQKNKKNKS